MSLSSLHLFAPYTAPADVMASIQELRARTYAADGAVPDGTVRVEYDEDKSSYHIVSIVDGKVVGCISADVDDQDKARIHSWALDKSRRGSRVGIQLALSCFSLADMLGLNSGTCDATVRNGSASILLKLGGMEERSYWCDKYDCDMVSIWFSPRLLSPKHRVETRRIKERLIQSQIDRL